MKRIATRTGGKMLLLAVAAAGVVGYASWHLARAAEGRGVSAPLPKAVEAGFRAAFPKARIVRTKAEPQILMTYEVDMVQDGVERTAELFVNGEVLVVEKNTDQAKLPKQVAAVLAREVGSGKVADIDEKEVRATIAISRWAKPKTEYEIEYTDTAGRKMILELDAAGRVLKKQPDREAGDEKDEREVSLKDIPRAARATILRCAGANKVRGVEEHTRNGQKLYEAEWLENGKEVEALVAADGKLLKKQAGDDDKGDAEDDQDD